MSTFLFPTAPVFSYPVEMDIDLPETDDLPHLDTLQIDLHETYPVEMEIDDPLEVPQAFNPPKQLSSTSTARTRNPFAKEAKSSGPAQETKPRRRRGGRYNKGNRNQDGAPNDRANSSHQKQWQPRGQQKQEPKKSQRKQRPRKHQQKQAPEKPQQKVNTGNPFRDALINGY